MSHEDNGEASYLEGANCLSGDRPATARYSAYWAEQGLRLVMYGNPEDRRTWSGTPSNLIRAFRQNGVPVATLNSSHPNLLLKGWQLVWNSLTRRSLSFRRGGAARAYCARRVAGLLNQTEESVLLHLSLNHLPLPRIRRPMRQFLYLDFTDALRGRYAARQESAVYTSEMRRLDTLAYAEMDGIFCASAASRDSLVEDYGIPETRISVVGTGFSSEFLRCKVTPSKYERPRLLFVSKVKNSWENKGGALLVEAFRSFRQQRPDATLTLVGQERFGAIASQCPGVEAHPYVTFDNLLRQFEEASIYAMPAMCEPWGLVYLEALASGTPVLGLSRLGIVEIACGGQFGFLSPEASPDAIAALLLKAHENSQVLQEKGLAAREFVRASFSWEKTASLMLDHMIDGRTRRVAGASGGGLSGEGSSLGA